MVPVTSKMRAEMTFVEGECRRPIGDAPDTGKSDGVGSCASPKWINQVNLAFDNQYDWESDF